MIRRLQFVALGLLALLVCEGRAQNDAGPPPPPSAVSTITVSTRVVAITALVRNKNGELLRDLDKSEFTVKEDGKPVSIRYFDKDSDLPLQIGLMIDTSGSQTRYFDEQARASNIFLRSMLTRPQDQGYVVRFDSNILLLQKLTSDTDKLAAALGMLHKEFPLQKDASTRRGTRLYDAIIATAQQVAGKERGRRAVIVLTDGEDQGSASNLELAVREAQKADVAVYTVLYTDHPGDPGITIDPQLEKVMASQHPGHSFMTGRVVMDHISLASGGRLFIVGKDWPIERIYKEIEDDMRMQYRLGYTPPLSPGGQYHVLEVKCKGKGLQTQARVGYYTPEGLTH